MINNNGNALGAPHGNSTGLPAFNDWPNDAGFETFEEQAVPVELKISGSIPAYAAGVLYRTGPGGDQVKTDSGDIFSVSHWFDGFCQTHRFVLVPSTNGEHIASVTYNSRHTCDKVIEEARLTGKVARTTFGQKRDPCESFFKKVMSSYQTLTAGVHTANSDVNVGVTIKANMPMPGDPCYETKPMDNAHGIGNLWLKTDATRMQALDPVTLEPTDLSSQDKIHPLLKGPFSAAHLRTDPVTGDWYNYNLEVGRVATYRIFRVSAKTGEATILATISGGDVQAAYIHSFMLTERFIVLCIYSSYYTKGGLTVMWTSNLLDAMEFDPNKKNVWLVIDRIGDQGLVGVYESEPHFSFHPVNAWDVPSKTEPGKFDIITDVPVYENIDVLKRFYYDNLKGSSPSALHYAGDKKASSRASLTRYKLSNVGTSTVAVTSPHGQVERVFKAPNMHSPELPTFNPNFATKPSRYIFGCCDRGNSTFLDGIIKFDSQTQTSQAWIQHAQSPGEPIFVPNPNGTDEDDGVLLSVVLDGTKGKSYLLVIDAKRFVEVGRAELDSVVGFGFHGAHVSASM